MSVLHHGVAVGPTGGAIVSAQWEKGELPLVTGYEPFAPGLAAIGDRIRQLIEDEPDSVITIDGGLHGLDLKSYLDDVRAPRRRLVYFQAQRPELRRWETGGRLRAAFDKRAFRIQRIGPGALALRAAVGDANRDDAGDLPDVVALSLAVIDRRGPKPRVG